MATVEAQLATWSTDGTGIVRILEADDDRDGFVQLHKGSITHSGTEASAEAAAKVVLNTYVSGSRGKTTEQQAKETRLGI